MHLSTVRLVHLFQLEMRSAATACILIAKVFFEGEGNHPAEAASMVMSTIRALSLAVNKRLQLTTVPSSRVYSTYTTAAW